MPITIDRVWTDKWTGERAIVQNKFMPTDHVRINISYVVSPDLGNPLTVFNFVLFFTYLNYYYNRRFGYSGEVVRTDTGSVYGWEGLSATVRLHVDGTNWITTMDLGHYFIRQSGRRELFTYRVVIDVADRSDLPVM